MIEDDEELIAKLQMEYISGASVDIVKDSLDWDIGLLYFTNLNLWFINSQKERFQVPFQEIIYIDDVKPRKSKKTTKFTKVLKADFVMNIDFRTTIDDNKVIRTVQVSAAKEILNALKTQLQVRLEHKPKPKRGALKLDKTELLRRFTVLEQLKIDEEDQLKYFLGLNDRELVNIMLERNRILQSVMNA